MASKPGRRGGRADGGAGRAAVVHNKVRRPRAQRHRRHRDADRRAGRQGLATSDLREGDHRHRNHQPLRNVSERRSQDFTSTIATPAAGTF
jgi:hypothetical protein